MRFSLTKQYDVWMLPIQKTCAGIKNYWLKVKNGPKMRLAHQKWPVRGLLSGLIIFQTILEHRLPKSDYLATP